jgi:hypothetical protein
MNGRRVSLYFAWSRHEEIGRDMAILENRYPALFEFRRAIWPHYEWARDPQKYSQDISGFLDHVVLFDFLQFQQVVTAETGKTVRVTERGRASASDNTLTPEYLDGCDTLIVVSLDHTETGQHALKEEVEAVRAFLRREEACLVVCPHHAVGAPVDQAAREVEFRHHGDGLVPAQQLIGGFAANLLSQLDVPVQNRFGLNPGRVSQTNDPAPLEWRRDLDDRRILEGVATFNLHPHLPHLHIAENTATPIRVLARQAINLDARPHPFVEAGNRFFNALLWAPPHATRAGSVFVCDATLWSGAFGGVPSLTQFWRNIARF